MKVVTSLCTADGQEFFLPAAAGAALPVGTVLYTAAVTPEYVTNTYHECGTSFATSIGYYLTGNHTDFSIAQIVWAAAGYKQ